MTRPRAGQRNPPEADVDPVSAASDFVSSTGLSFAGVITHAVFVTGCISATRGCGAEAMRCGTGAAATGCVARGAAAATGAGCTIAVRDPATPGMVSRSPIFTMWCGGRLFALAIATGLTLYLRATLNIVSPGPTV